MSLVLEILDELWNTTLNYKGIKVNLFGIPRFKNTKPNTLRVALNRMQDRNLIQNKNGKFFVTEKGKYYLTNKEDVLKNFDSPFNSKMPKNLIVMFDIPQDKNKHRNWLRKQLREFGYIMIQKSVWVGPSPLPKEFKDYLKEVKIQKNLKTFKLAQGYKD